MVDDLIKMFPEEAICEGLRSTLEEVNDEKLRSAKSRPKRNNAGTGIYRLFVSFDGKTYKSGKKIFIEEQESKDEIDYFMKVAKNVMFTHMSAKTGIKKVGEKSTIDMIK